MTSQSVDVSAILSEGRYYILEDYAMRSEMYKKVVDAFMEAIEDLEGAACRSQVEKDGLGQLHKHFPVEKVRPLEAAFLKRMRDDLYYWSFRVGADDLGLPHPFYCDHLVMVRIHYPHLQARKARHIEDAPYPYGERLRLATAALKNPAMLTNFLNKRSPQARAAQRKFSRYDAVAYHGEMPTPARAHGPHIDTWYGHSYDGINLWWAIDGVNQDNTVILYPEMFGRPMEFDPVSMYLAPGEPVTKPVKHAFKPGELLVFNPEVLHGTQVNISDETRVALTTRLNPRTPRFAPAAPFHFEHWLSSVDLQKKKKVHSLTVFPSSQFQGQPSITKREPLEDTRTVHLKRPMTLPSQGEIAICPAALLREGEKLAVDLNNARVIIKKEAGQLRAYTRVCPHLGVDLVDGYHDEQEVYCPGHGISFRWSDGESHCKSFRLKAFIARENDGQIFLSRKATIAGAADSVPEADESQGGTPEKASA